MAVCDSALIYTLFSFLYCFGFVNYQSAAVLRLPLPQLHGVSVCHGPFIWSQPVWCISAFIINSQCNVMCVGKKPITPQSVINYT